MKTINTENWNKNWDSFSTFSFNGNTYVYSYKSTLGTYDLCVIDRIDDKVYWSRVDRGEIKTGFTSAETFVEKGHAYLMMYNTSTGLTEWFQLKVNK